MPTYRSITLSLVSQYDILTIPEYAPPSRPSDPFSDTPSLVSHAEALVSVYIPTYPGSQFWLAYSISPPHPPDALYYFKLFLNGSHVVSWGCGKEDVFKGKTMFGITEGKRGLDRRVFAFERDDGARNGYEMNRNDSRDVMEVRVFRSKGRMKMTPESADLPPSGVKQGGASSDSSLARTGGIRYKSRLPSPLPDLVDSEDSLANGDRLSRKHPQRYYKYALVDPLDQPFATFRYYYRTWDELERLGVTSPNASSAASTLSSCVGVIEPAHYQKDSASKDLIIANGRPKGGNADVDKARDDARCSTSNSSVISLDSDLLTGIIPPPNAVFAVPSSPRPMRITPTKALPSIYPRAPTPVPEQRICTRSLEEDADAMSLGTVTRECYKIEHKEVAAAAVAKGKWQAQIRTPQSETPVKRSKSVGVLRGVIDSAVRRRARTD